MEKLTEKYRNTLFRKGQNRNGLNLLLLIVAFVSCFNAGAQNKNSFLNAQYNPDQAIITETKFQKNKSSIVSVEFLEEEKIQNIRPNLIRAYAFMIDAEFQVKNETELKKVFSKKNKVQTIIDKVNLYFDTPLSSKELFNANFPKAFFFRRPENVAGFTYEQWEKEYIRLGGICNKAMCEELFGMTEVQTQHYMNRFAINNPKKLVLLHFNGRSRDPNWRSEAYSAGHWIYHPGCLLEKNISANDSVLQVSDVSLFKLGFGRNAKKNDDIVIVPLDENGEKLWDEAEQVTLVSKGKGAIKVIRGRYGTSAKNFTAKTTYIAPHVVEGPWGPPTNNLMWYYNLSSTCPTDKNGKQCADIFAEEIGSWFANDGELFAFNGIQFDIASWTMDKSAYGRYVDIDTDGIADKGYLNNENVFGIGTYHFYELLRNALGKDKLLLGDGGVDYAMRAVDVANGMEAEGLCDWGDVYTEFSKPISFFTYWLEHGINPHFSYVTHKDKMEGNDAQKLKRERMVLATAQCLGIAANTFRHTKPENGYRKGIADELVKGMENKSYWLGSPKGDLIELSKLKEPTSNFSLKNTHIKPFNCQVQLNNNGLKITAQPNQHGNMKLLLKNVILPDGDVIISFDAKSETALPGFKDIIPRHISAKILGVKPNKHNAEKVLNYIGCTEYSPCNFYFREMDSQTVDIEIEIEGSGSIDIQNFMLLNDTQALAREFENGIVLVNPSTLPYKFNLETLFPNTKLKRLTATSKQDSKVNNGKRVSATVTLPPLDGLFLEKIKK
ncbi:hypothetical protein [uncultured Draconibacterium sp.]|uniref:hypothetical protein n=1 Tax=uncultured Draconibacterium sp. TaxID=1573823 RepID=UPI0029C00135|nr:hypothetical protein [uncultured Draconibacterium sp.]